MANKKIKIAEADYLNQINEALVGTIWAHHKAKKVVQVNTGAERSRIYVTQWEGGIPCDAELIARMMFVRFENYEIVDASISLSNLPTEQEMEVVVRLMPSQIEAIDQWRATKKDDLPRAEAVRLLFEAGLYLETERASTRTWCDFP